MIWASLIGVLAAIRIVRLFQFDDFGPVQDLRRWWLNRWPGEATEFFDSEVEGDETYGWRLIKSGRDAMLDHYEDADDGTRIPKFVAIDPHPLGELYECPRCLSYWAALAAVLAWLWLPWPVWWAIMLPLAISQLIIWGVRLDPH